MQVSTPSSWLRPSQECPALAGALRQGCARCSMRCRDTPAAASSLRPDARRKSSSKYRRCSACRDAHRSPSLPSIHSVQIAQARKLPEHARPVRTATARPLTDAQRSSSKSADMRTWAQKGVKPDLQHQHNPYVLL